MRTHRFARLVVASAVCVCALVTPSFTSVTMAQAATPNPVDKVADPATYMDYPARYDTEAYLETASTPGRIWVDKSVFSQTIDVEDGQTAGTTQLPLGADELGVALSALGSTTQVNEEQPVPIDLSIILDNSYSMVQCVGSTAYCNTAATYQNSRAYAMVQSINAAIHTIMRANPDNRVAMVEFGTGAGILWQLGVPAPINPAGDYVTFTPPTGTGTTMYMNYGPTSAERLQIGTVGGTVQSTNMQRGIVTGMNILASQPHAAVSGASQRYPNVLLFTDGEPTLSVNNASWWNPPTTAANEGPSSPTATQFYGNGFKAALAAALLKNQVTAVYNDPAYNQANGLAQVNAQVFTVGLGIDALSEQGRNLAIATLDPAHQIGQTTNSMNAGFTSAWNTFSGGTGVSVPVNTGQNFTVSQPGAAVAAFNPANPQVAGLTLSPGMGYNDAYYSADTAVDLADDFRSIVATITSTTPNFPIQIEDGSNAAASGFVTFTDPLGPFMHVSDMSLLTFCSNLESATGLDACTPAEFANPVKTDLGGGLTRYTFQGNYEANISAGSQSVANIIVTVQSYASLAKGDVVTLQIPDALLPTNDSVVTIKPDGTPASLERYISRPVHLYFKVSPKPGVADAIADPLALNTAAGAQPGDGTALAAYIAGNTDAGGVVRFYSNDFTAGSGAGSNATALSTAAWVPATHNSYYRFGSDSPLYADQALTIPLTPALWAGLPDAATVYYGNDVYYFADSPADTQVAVRHDALSATKAQLTAAEDTTYQITAVNGQMTAPAGMLDFARPGLLNAVKCLASGWSGNAPVCNDPDPAGDGNLTGTSTMARQMVFDSDLATALLGNDGFLGYDLPGQLAISKTVQAAAGLNPDPATSFTFSVALHQAGTGAPVTGDFSYSVFDQADTTTVVRSGTLGCVAADCGTVSLTAGQEAVVYGLPDGTSYTVAEQTLLPSGYSVAQPSTGIRSGLIKTGLTQTADFVNAYQPRPVSVTLDATKTLTGRNWASGDKFAAWLCPYGESGTPNAVDCDLAPFVQDGTGNTGTAAFPALTFDAPGTFAYTMTEDAGDPAPGVSYSGAAYLYVVTVSDDGAGQLSASGVLTQTIGQDGIAVSPPATASGADFANSFSAAAITEPLEATKMVDDTSLPGGLITPTESFPFTFTYLGADLQTGRADGSVPAPYFSGQSTAGGSVTVGSAGSAVVSPVVSYVHDHIGHSLFFNATEAGSSAPGYLILSDAVWFWRVDVSLDSASSAIETTVTNCATTVAAITAAAPFGGCDPATAAYATTASPDRLFVNTYTPTAAAVELSAVKTLEGRPWTSADSFSFALAGNDSATLSALASGAIGFNTGSGSCSSQATLTVGYADQAGNQAPFCFGLDFTQQGDYQFALTESGQAGPASGMINDTHTAVYDIAVTPANASGQLTATVTLRGQTSTTASFTNRYQASYTLAGLNVWKSLTGRDLAIGEFSFTLKAADQASCDKALLPSPACQASFTNADDANDPIATALPAEFNFTQDDLGQTFSYTVAESASPAAGGVTYDPTVYTVDVTPQFDQATGAIYAVTSIHNSVTRATNTYDSRDSTPRMDFANSYQAAPVQATLTFTKTLQGRAWTPADTFGFDIAAVTGGAPMPAQTAASVGYADQSGGQAAFSFGPITFDAAGTYQYRVAEDVSSPPAGVELDDVASVATVVVTDDGTGQLAATVSYDGSPDPVNRDFVNYYQARPVQASLSFSKVLSGRAWLPADSFQFSLEAAAGSPPMPAATSVTVTSANKDSFGFGPITYTQAGRYLYTVAESAGVPDGVVADTAPRTVVVDVSDDGLGALSAQVSYPDGSVFENVYAPGSVAASLSFSKTLSGRDWSDTDLFDFALSPVTPGAPMPGTADASATARDKDFGFGPIVFTKVGTYEYSAVETSPAGPVDGVTPDPSPHNAVVTVSDDLAGNLVAAVAYPDGAVFTNTYEAAPAQVSLSFTKSLTGRAWASADRFQFTIAAAMDDPPMPSTTTVAVGFADQTANQASFGFGPITYTAPGEYLYTVAETSPGNPAGGLFVDSSARVVEVSVVDNGLGQLVASTTYPDGQAFTNVYAPDAAAVDLAFSKVLTGRGWSSSDVFGFQLSPLTPGAPAPSGTSHASVTADDKDSFGFGPIVFTQTGVYEYSVAEVSPAIPTGGITPDPAARKVVVTVTDDSQGKLVADVAYPDGTVFTNTYSASITWSVDQSITLKGRPMDADEFGFKVVPADQASADVAGIPLDGRTWDNQTAEGDGVAELMDTAFPAVHFTQDDAGQTYCYEFSQVIPATGGLTGVTYDPVTYQVCAAVSDAGDGNLVVSMTVSGGDAKEARVIRSDDPPGTSWTVLPFVDLYEAAEPSAAPSTAEPSSAEPSVEPSTAEPSTAEPSTTEPSTAEPSTAEPSTAEPSTAEPSTSPSPGGSGTAVPGARGQDTGAPGAGTGGSLAGDSSDALSALIVLLSVGGGAWLFGRQIGRISQGGRIRQGGRHG